MLLTRTTGGGHAIGPNLAVVGSVLDGNRRRESRVEWKCGERGGGVRICDSWSQYRVEWSAKSAGHKQEAYTPRR